MRRKNFYLDVYLQCTYKQEEPLDFYGYIFHMDDAETMVFYRAVQEFINRLNCCVVFAISNYSLITLQDESEAGHNVLNRYFIVKYM